LAVLLSATVLLAPGLAGCAFSSPQTTATPYPAADGANGSIAAASGGGVLLRNFLLVGTAKDAPATLIGAVANEGSAPVDVQFTVLDGTSAVAQGSVTAVPGELTQIGPDGAATVRVASLPTAPGTVLKLAAQSGDGDVTISLPVLAAEGPYASIAP
jgi:hypothetical protein